MKIFVANSIYSYISRLVVYFPFILGTILSSTLFPKDVFFFIGGIILSYLLYCCNFCWFLGYLKFKKEFLYIPSDFAPRISRLQYKEKIYYDEICAIEFKFRDGNSRGKPLWKADCINYLEIITNDNCIHRIAIGKYSHRQWKKIENEIVNRTHDVLVLQKADELIKKIK